MATSALSPATTSGRLYVVQAQRFLNFLTFCVVEKSVQYLLATSLVLFPIPIPRRLCSPFRIIASFRVSRPWFRVQVKEIELTKTARKKLKEGQEPPRQVTKRPTPCPPCRAPVPRACVGAHGVEVMVCHRSGRFEGDHPCHRVRRLEGSWRRANVYCSLLASIFHRQHTTDLSHCFCSFHLLSFPWTA